MRLCDLQPSGSGRRSRNTPRTTEVRRSARRLAKTLPSHPNRTQRAQMSFDKVMGRRSNLERRDQMYSAVPGSSISPDPARDELGHGRSCVLPSRYGAGHGDCFGSFRGRCCPYSEMWCATDSDSVSREEGRLIRASETLPARRLVATTEAAVHEGVR